MAVAPTGAIYKALIFDGESSRNYGVYITGEAVYNAPERDVEMISIPGRNGAYALDKGRFQNIEVSYPAGIFADTETNFADAISDFRNFLCSRNGYVRLTDEYNPNEYRIAVYKSGLEVTPAQLKAGEFEIIFECKPQRWLTDGENKVSMGAWGDTTTETGDIVEIDNSDGILALKTLTMSGTTLYRTGKNLLDFDTFYSASTKQRCTATNADGTVTITATAVGSMWIGLATAVGSTIPSGTFTINAKQGDKFTSNNDGLWYEINASGEVLLNANMVQNSAYTVTNADCAKLGFRLIFGNSSAIGDTKVVYPQFELGSTATTYEAYQGTTYTSPSADDVELLTGINYLWDDTGSITIEYGQDPNIIVNPTLFDASPMLEFDGYGAIQLNGYEVELYHVTLGDVTLWDRNPMGIYKADAFPCSLEKTFDTEKIQTNDVLTLGSNEEHFSVVIMGIRFFVNSGYTFVTGTTHSGSGTMPVQFRTISYPGAGSSVYPSIEVRFNAEPLTFTTGTSGIYTYHITVNGTIKNISTQVQTAYEVTGDYTVEYDGDRTITYTWNPAIVTDSTGAITYISSSADYYVSCSPGILHAESSVLAVGNPTYIDTEIGESYMIENGVYISLNGNTELGTDLPVLSPGNNTVTYDNTVTDLKIIPRWWKI